MASKTIVSWYPDFGTDGNFVTSYGWEVVLKHIFTVLVTRKGSRQWNPEFGCRLLDMLFEINLQESDFVQCIKEAFQWIPYITLSECNCKIEDIPNHTGKRALLKLKVEYNGESKSIEFDIPSDLDIMNGSIHDIKVNRKT